MITDENARLLGREVPILNKSATGRSSDSGPRKQIPERRCMWTEQ
jgi:hypothetical protein